MKKLIFLLLLAGCIKEPINNPVNTCETVTRDFPRPQSAISTGTKCVHWYWETCYDVYQSKGSEAAVRAWTKGVFEQVRQIYLHDSIIVILDSVKVWTTQDPYSIESNNYAWRFDRFTFQGPMSFPGDFATLIGFGSGGGKAWMNEYCDLPKYRKAVCVVYPTYSNYPAYSWTVENIAHENGHLLGSAHTHDCAWNGNSTAIDGCYSTPCANPGLPSGGGTIMSYCQLTSVGINFLNGFGPQPAARIRNNINNASCLRSCTDTVIITPPPTDTTKDTVIITPPPVINCKCNISATIIKRLNDLYVDRSKSTGTGCTNFYYAWKKNGDTTTWRTQTIYKTNYKAGDSLTVFVRVPNQVCVKIAGIRI